MSLSPLVKSQETRHGHSLFHWLSTLFAKVCPNKQSKDGAEGSDHWARRTEKTSSVQKKMPAAMAARWLAVCVNNSTMTSECRFVLCLPARLPACQPASLPATPLRSFQASPINLIGRLHAAAYVPATCSSSRRHTLTSPMPEHLALLHNVPDSIAIDLVWLRCKRVYK